jgi:putative sterol carrier protein
VADQDSLIAALQARSTALRGLGHRVRFEVTGDAGDSVILLDATGGVPVIEPADSATEADTILRLSGDDLAKLIARKLSPMLAFATGRLRVEGSKGVAMKLAGLLDED